MTSTDYYGKLKLANELLDRGETESSIREFGQILEMALRSIIMGLSAQHDNYDELQAIQQSVEKIGSGKLTVAQFGFGQLVGVYREAKVEPILKRLFDSNFKRTRKIDWASMVEWRNQVTHQKVGSGIRAESVSGPDHDDALDVSRWAKAFLYDCELVTGNADSAPQTGSATTGADCSNCGTRQDEAWNFCPSCGTPSKLDCASCKKELKSEWKICPYCEEVVSSLESVTEVRMRWEYMTMCKGAWMDGVVNREERENLDTIRLELGIDVDEATRLEEKVAPKNFITYMHKVEDFLVDSEISSAEREYLIRVAAEQGIDEAHAQAIEDSCLSVGG